MTIKCEMFKSFVFKQIHVFQLICKNYIKDLCSCLNICIKNKIKTQKYKTKQNQNKKQKQQQQNSQYQTKEQTKRKLKLN